MRGSFVFPLRLSIHLVSASVCLLLLFFFFFWSAGCVRERAVDTGDMHLVPLKSFLFPSSQASSSSSSSSFSAPSTAVHSASSSSSANSSGQLSQRRPREEAEKETSADSPLHCKNSRADAERRRKPTTPAGGGGETFSSSSMAGEKKTKKDGEDDDEEKEEGGKETAGRGGGAEATSTYCTSSGKEKNTRQEKKKKKRRRGKFPLNLPLSHRGPRDRHRRKRKTATVVLGDVSWSDRVFFLSFLLLWRVSSVLLHEKEGKAQARRGQVQQTLYTERRG